MKKIVYLFLAFMGFAMTSCMNHHETAGEYIYGNPAIGESNTKIADLKAQYKKVITQSGVEQITTPTVIEGVVVADDESGNLYKQISIQDETGGIIVSINTTGIYAFIPVGQKIVVDCKDLYIGGYGNMAQIGGLYGGKIGRMDEKLWKQHVRLEGTPSKHHKELEPLEIDETFLENKDNLENVPLLVKIKNGVFTEADGETAYAPEEGATLVGNEVNRNLKVGNKNLIFRVSTYCNFANDIMPQEPVEVVGLLTRYRDDWQLKARTSRDITIIENK